MQQKLSFYLSLFIGATFLFSSCSNDDDDININPMEFSSSEYQEDYELLLGDTLKIEPSILNVPEDVSYRWVLNEENIGSEKNLSYVPKESGTFQLEFTASAGTDSIQRVYNITVDILPMEFSSSEYQEDYELLLGDTLKIEPSILNVPEGVTYRWLLNKENIGSDQNLSYVPEESGTFQLEFKASAGTDALQRIYNITVTDPYELYFRPKTEGSSEFISEIIEYKPAPGQYINSTYGTPEDADRIIGGKSTILSLGAWGGYVIFSFDHTIENRTDAKDFVVYGNAMNGLSEPGIVQVSFDENGNGIADDAWYELSGSAHRKEETLLDYEITYSNPEEYANIPWVDSKENRDSVMVNSYHTQNYYPLFIDEQDEVTYTGTRVYPTVKLEGFASIDALEWGYADNYDADYSTYGGNAMEIDWAVDEESNPVDLRGIDFVKVYTGAQGNAGWLGEISTEIKGASDLSMVE